MDKQAQFFKDDILHGISLSIKNLQAQDMEGRSYDGRSNFQITKLNPHFRNLINSLDLAFSFGLKDGGRGYWPFIKKVAHTSVIKMVEQHKNARNDITKGYIWLFLTFIEHSFDCYVNMMINENKLLKFYYKEFSLLRDVEKREIFSRLMVGIEELNFQLNFLEPYLDYGHDPVLRHEKIVVRRAASPTFLYEKPDVTLHTKGKIPDLIYNHQRRSYSSASSSVASSLSDVSEPSFRRQPACSSDSRRHTISAADNIVYRHKTKKKRRPLSQGVDVLTEASSSLPSDLIETTEASVANKSSLHEVMGCTEHLPPSKERVKASEENVVILQTSDPMLKSYSQGENEYEEFLKEYKNDENRSSLDDPPSLHSEIQASLQGLEGLTMDKTEQSCVTPSTNYSKYDKHLACNDLASCDWCGFYVINDVNAALAFLNEKLTETINRHAPFIINPIKGKHNGSSTSDEEEIQIYRADSFDKFCDRDSLEEALRGAPSPQNTSYDSLDVSRRNVSQGILVSPTASQSSLSKLSSSRLNTKKGILLPWLPRRPSPSHDAKRVPEYNLEENAKVLLSLQILSSQDEYFIRMFEVFVGHINGHSVQIFLLISNISLYFLKRKGTVQVEFEKVLSVNIDSINKIKIGIHFQEVFIIHDEGCNHFSTNDETLTRYLVASIMGVMSGKEVDEISEHSIVANTENYLHSLVEDWLVCHNQMESATTIMEEEEPFHFTMVHYSSMLDSGKARSKVMKVGYMRYKDSSYFADWKEAYFTLRGNMLHRYSIKKSQELTSVYDLSKLCGGCVRGDDIDGWYTCKIMGSEGVATVVELAVMDENEINDWIVTICQVVADSRTISNEESDEPENYFPCSSVVTQQKVLLFNQEAVSGRLILKDSIFIKDITQVFVDNTDRTFCCLSVEHHFEENSYSEKRLSLLKFNSEFELGKFEKQLSLHWTRLYQVPLQFVLLSDPALKHTIQTTLSYRDLRAEKTNEEIETLLKDYDFF